jgi:hypothetical protein
MVITLPANLPPDGDDGDGLVDEVVDGPNVVVERTGWEVLPRAAEGRLVDLVAESAGLAALPHPATDAATTTTTNPSTWHRALPIRAIF